MSVADRALAAHAAEEEEKRLRAEAAKARRKGIAVDAIGRVLEGFGMDTTDLEELIEPDYRAKRWSVMIPIDDDCALHLTSEPDDEIVSTRLVPAVELDRDIPPGEPKTPRGVYGCYGLDKYVLEGISTLADLGRAITKVREARVAWRKKHGVSQESEMQKGESDGTA